MSFVKQHVQEQSKLIIPVLNVLVIESGRTTDQDMTDTMPRDCLLG